MEAQEIELDLVAILQMGMDQEDTAKEIVEYLIDHSGYIRNFLDEEDGLL